MSTVTIQLPEEHALWLKEHAVKTGRSQDEIVREQIFLRTQEEVPYGATVETESFTERKDGSVRIDATIYVARSGHKAIMIGEGGKRIREIGSAARRHLAQLLERKVHLFLNVKERAGWDEEGARLRAIGLKDLPE